MVQPLVGLCRHRFDDAAAGAEVYGATYFLKGVFHFVADRVKAGCLRRGDSPGNLVGLLLGTRQGLRVVVLGRVLLLHGLDLLLDVLDDDLHLLDTLLAALLVG